MTPELRELYQEVILDHYKRPRHFGAVEGFTARSEGYNPLCGDQIELMVRIEGDEVADIGFRGCGCAICTASASMMSEAVAGKKIEDVRELFRAFQAAVTGGTCETDLGELEVLVGVREHPVRIKCATLAWHTLRAALDHEERASTEA